MSDPQTAQLQGAIDRLQDGESAVQEAARHELIALAYGRLCRLAHKIFQQDFIGLGGLHETGSVLNEAVLRLLTALRTVRPPTVADFFRFAALQIRRVLLDMARKHRKQARPPGGPGAPPEPADSSHDPERLARWTEFHRGIKHLPREEREVVHLCFYLGLSQARAAELLGLHPREVSRRWVRAIRRLPDPS
jgi:RNA polymerase sigma-70 factor (ECF subfamily)